MAIEDKCRWEIFDEHGGENNLFGPDGKDFSQLSDGTTGLIDHVRRVGGIICTECRALTTADLNPDSQFPLTTSGGTGCKDRRQGYIESFLSGPDN